MRGWTRVDTGVYESATGRAKIRIRPAPGAERIELELPDVEIARVLHGEGVRLRDVDGLDLRDVWSDRLLDAAIDKRLKGDGKDLSTVASTFDAYFADRLRRVVASDPTVSGLDRNSGTLRRTSFDAERAEYATYIAPWLGGVPLPVLGDAEVRGWVTRLATDASATGHGYAYGTQLGALNLLRQAIREVVPARYWPPDFPWNQVKPIAPAEPATRPRDPAVWGGTTGAKPPGVTYSQAERLARGQRSCFRIAIYWETIVNGRSGEVFGTRLRDIVDIGGELWWFPKAQRDGRTDEVHEWVKSAASAQPLPIPAVLDRYVRSYVRRYHGYDFSNPAPELGARFLVVTSTGRDRNGRFMAGHQSTMLQDWADTVAAAGLSYDKLGYDLRLHDLRRVGPSYLASAPRLLHAYLQRMLDNAANASDVERVDAAIDEARVLGDMDVSLWARHAIGKRAGGGGASTTFEDYVLRVPFGDADQLADTSPGGRSGARVAQQPLPANADALRRIAGVIDALFSCEVPGGVHDEPDDWDTVPAIAPDDPDWVSLHRACEELELSDSRVRALLTSDVLEGQQVWWADGDREVNGPVWVVSRRSLDRARDHYDRLRGTGVEKVLGTNRKNVARLVARDLLTPYQFTDLTVYDRDETAAILASVLGVMAEVVERHPRYPEAYLRKRFIETVNAADRTATVRVLMPHAAKVSLGQVQYWLGLLADGRAIRRYADGTYRAVDTAAVTAIAMLRAHSYQSPKRGRPANAGPTVPAAVRGDRSCADDPGPDRVTKRRHTSAGKRDAVKDAQGRTRTLEDPSNSADSGQRCDLGVPVTARRSRRRGARSVPCGASSQTGRGHRAGVDAFCGGGVPGSGATTT